MSPDNMTAFILWDAHDDSLFSAEREIGYRSEPAWGMNESQQCEVAWSLPLTVAILYVWSLCQVLQENVRIYCCPLESSVAGQHVCRCMLLDADDEKGLYAGCHSCGETWGACWACATLRGWSSAWTGFRRSRRLLRMPWTG